MRKLQGEYDLQSIRTLHGRLDYLSPLANNVAYAIAVEKLTDWNCRSVVAIRVLVVNLQISSHLLGMGVFGMDAGAWTPFMYTFTERELYAFRRVDWCSLYRFIHPDRRSGTRYS